MSKLERSTEARVPEGNQVYGTFKGFTSGVGGGPHSGRTAAYLVVHSGGLVVGRLKPGFPLPRLEIQEVALSDIRGVKAEMVSMTGIAGQMNRKTERHLLGPALGATSQQPAVVVSVPLSPFIFAFAPKHRDPAIEAEKALKQALAHR